MSEDSNNQKKFENIVEQLSFAAIKEQRSRRRWRIFFIFLFFLYLTPFLLISLEHHGLDLLENVGDEVSEKHTALIQLEGEISSADEANADVIIRGLNRAFEDDNTKGVILSINSPGGSPVQSSYIYDEMIRLREKYPEIPLHVVVNDMAASGGYFVAAAAENIYVNKSSIVGSIGVRMDSFGFVGFIEKLGVERRLLTAGENKGLLDPFLPENQSQKQHLSLMLNDVHKHFKDAVKEGRGDRLKETDQIFSGLVWTGEKAIELGLVDDFGSVRSVARDVIEAKEIIDFTPEELFFDRLVTKISVNVAKQLKLLTTESIKLQ